MKGILKFAIGVIWHYVQRFLYTIKIRRLKEELKTEKKEATDAVNEASESYIDFMREYSEYAGTRLAEDQTTSSPVREGAQGDEEVRSDSGEAAPSDKGTGGCD